MKTDTEIQEFIDLKVCLTAFLMSKMKHLYRKPLCD